MALDQSQLLQMLLQGGGGGISISPTSGLQEPSLSGLMLGPQGMGFGGGESLMGGGPTGFGGGAGGGLGGLDLSQLLAQLQAAPGVTGAGLTTGLGFGSLGGGFGAGGQIGQEPTSQGPTPSQQGQAGLGAAGTAAQFLRLLREGTGLAKTLSQLFPKGAESSQVSDINSILATMGISGTPFVPTASVVSGASGGSVPSLPFEPSQTLPFQIDPSILSGASGGGLLAGGAPLTGAELSARLGAQGLGDIPSIGAPVGALEGLGGLQGALGGAGVLSNLGFGALNLSQGNVGAGLGGLLGTGAGLSLGAALAPETAGLSLLLGGLGGGAGGFLGGLLGGGGPSEAWQSFGSRLAEGLPKEISASNRLLSELASATSRPEVQSDIQRFRSAIEQIGVGGFSGIGATQADWDALTKAQQTASQAFSQLPTDIEVPTEFGHEMLASGRAAQPILDQFLKDLSAAGATWFPGAFDPSRPLGETVDPSQLTQFTLRGRPRLQYLGGLTIPGLPGATGTAHEGGLIFNPAPLNDMLQQALAGALARIG